MTVTNKTSDSKAPVRRKPYTPPRVVSYGHVKDVVQGASGPRADSGSTRSMCWIAEALYGLEDPRTILLRSWLTGIHAGKRQGWLFVELYRRVGRQVGGLIRAGLLPRWTLLPLFRALTGKAFDASARLISDARHRRAL